MRTSRREHWRVNKVMIPLDHGQWNDNTPVGAVVSWHGLVFEDGLIASVRGWPLGRLTIAHNAAILTPLVN